MPISEPSYVRSSEAQKTRGGGGRGEAREPGGKGNWPSGPFKDLGSCRNSPSAPSNEPHTSPVPGYEAVEATGVASVGAIEPASSFRIIRRSPTSDEERKGEALVGDAPQGRTGLNSLTTHPTGGKKRLCLVGSLRHRRFLGKFGSRPKLPHGIAPDIRMRERVGSGERLPEAECHAADRRTDASGPSQGDRKERTRWASHM